MKTSPVVSVIVPVYNEASYLCACMDSLLVQSFSDLEVICVDGGSTDASLRLLKDYESKDTRVRILQEKTRNCGEARNLGMAAAKGTYLVFQDADDFSEPNMLATLIQKAEETAADVVLGRMRTFYNIQGTLSEAYGLNMSILMKLPVFSRIDLPDRIFQCCSSETQAKLFRRDFLSAHALSFPSLRDSESLPFTYTALCLAKKIAWVPDAVANYRVQKVWNVGEERPSPALCCCQACELLYDALHALGLYDEVEKSFVSLAAERLNHTIQTVKEDTVRMDALRSWNAFFRSSGILDGEGMFSNQAQIEQARGLPYLLAWRDRMTQCAAPLPDPRLPAAEGTPAVSVIVPIYNVDAYLRDCLESIVSQTLENIEILCINDGSTDGSLAIAQEYAARDPRIRLWSQTNHGLSAARNEGIRQARGEYLYFLDSDDYIEPDALEMLYTHAVKNRLDVLCFDAEAFVDGEYDERHRDEIMKVLVRTADYPGVFRGANLLGILLANNDYYVGACCRIIRRAYCLNANLRFIPGIIAEDVPFAFRCMLLADRVSYLGKLFYHYRLRGRSITSSGDDYRTALSYFLGCMYMYNTLCSAELSDSERTSAISLLRQTIEVARGLYRALPTAEKNAYLGMYPEEQMFFDLLIRQPVESM